MAATASGVSGEAASTYRFPYLDLAQLDASQWRSCGATRTPPSSDQGYGQTCGEQGRQHGRPSASSATTGRRSPSKPGRRWFTFERKLPPLTVATMPTAYPEDNDSDDLTLVRVAYDAVAADYAAQLGDELTHKPLDRALLTALAELSTDGPLTDVGCGPGHVTAFLAERHRDVLGLDLSPQMISTANRRYPDLRFTVADMRRLPVDRATWAGIAALYSVIHLDAAQRADSFADFRRVLREGGWLLLAFHVDDADHHPGNIAHHTSWFGHDVQLDGHFFNPDVITAELAAADLHVTARLDRDPDPAIEYPSRRAYLLAQAGRRHPAS